MFFQKDIDLIHNAFLHKSRILHIPDRHLRSLFQYKLRFDIYIQMHIRIFRIYKSHVFYNVLFEDIQRIHQVHHTFLQNRSYTV